MSSVTIAIPIYNADLFLKDAVQSIINQTYQDWILYLVNDGSTDKSLDIMREFAAKDSRIIVINDGRNKGLVTRLNQTINICDTKYYARMDADDIMYITRIEEQMRFLESHQEVDVCGTAIMTIDDKNNIIGTSYGNGPTKSFVHPTVMGKTEWFKANPYANWAVRAEDCELWLRTGSRSKFYCIGKPLLFYREFGVPTFKKYFLTQKTMIRIARRYKLYGESFGWCIQKVIGVYCRIIVCIILEALGKMDVLVSLRKRRPVPSDLHLNKQDLLKSIDGSNGK